MLLAMLLAPRWKSIEHRPAKGCWRCWYPRNTMSWCWVQPASLDRYPPLPLKHTRYKMDEKSRINKHKRIQLFAHTCTRMHSHTYTHTGGGSWQQHIYPGNIRNRQMLSGQSRGVAKPNSTRCCCSWFGACVRAIEDVHIEPICIACNTLTHANTHSYAKRWMVRSTPSSATWWILPLLNVPFWLPRSSPPPCIPFSDSSLAFSNPSHLLHTRNVLFRAVCQQWQHATQLCCCW